MERYFCRILFTFSNTKYDHITQRTYKRACMPYQMVVQIKLNYIYLLVSVCTFSLCVWKKLKLLVPKLWQIHTQKCEPFFFNSNSIQLQSKWVSNDFEQIAELPVMTKNATIFQYIIRKCFHIERTTLVIVCSDNNRQTPFSFATTIASSATAASISLDMAISTSLRFNSFIRKFYFNRCPTEDI